MADFERAVDDGLGFKVDLTPAQARTGFDRLLVLGVRLSADEQQGAAALETLLAHHQYGRSGFSLVPQGTPTNNTEGAGSGFTRGDDADASFDERRSALAVHTRVRPAPQAGRPVARRAARDRPGGARPGAARGRARPARRAGDADGALAGDARLLPGDDDATRWSTTQTSSTRAGSSPATSAAAARVPAIRIGAQPYGILPDDRVLADGLARPPRGAERRGAGGPARLPATAARHPARGRPGLGRDGPRACPECHGRATRTQSLLGVLGLHPASVEFHHRYAESLEHLFNHLNFFGLGAVLFQALLASALDTPAQALLRRLGHDGEEQPAVLSKYFLGGQGALRGPVVDDRPLSETEPVRVWTSGERNYLRWLIDAAGSLDALRVQPDFIDDRPPTALLYLLLRHALILGYADAGRELHRTAGFDQEVLRALKREPAFVHVDTGAAISESRWAPLYKAADVVGGVGTVAEHISGVLATASETADLREQLEAIELLADASTARLERALAEHVDCCTYRFDAWLLGFVHLQLETMRAARRDGEHDDQKRAGVHLGAYGWLEDVRREPRELSEVELPEDLVDVFGGPKRPPLMRDSTNGGYIHAPSLNQAVTAAVLRNGYLANASPGAPDAMAVNLSSERVRLAMGVLEGIRNGQSLASLLGYRLERGLHDRHTVAEVDMFVFALRKAFPLRADRLSTTATGPGIAIDAIEARNVVDGLRLVEHVKRTGVRTYPFGISTLPGASPAQRGAIDAEVDALLNVHDAIADLALAEGVHQAVQGNFDRASGTLAAYTTGRHPPEPEVVRTPATGVTLTHRVGLHLEPGLAAPAGATPRAIAEPAVNAWLATLLPGLDEIACRARWQDPVTGTAQSLTVTMSDLDLQPLDLLALVRTEDQQAMTELGDRIVSRVLALAAPRPDAVFDIRYMERGAAPFSVFEVAPLVSHLRSLLVRGRPLRAGDLTLPNSAAHEADATSKVDPLRIEGVKTIAEGLIPDLDAYLGPLDLLLGDQPNRRQDVLDGIDGFIDAAAELLERAARLGTPQTGWGFAIVWRRDQYAGLVTRLSERVARWDERLVEFGLLLDAYDNLPAPTPAEERFKLLQQAETLVSTTLDPLPATPDLLRTALDAMGLAFQGRRNQLDALARGTPRACPGCWPASPRCCR